MINATDEFILDLQDQVQRVERLLSWLVARSGGDPAVIGDVTRARPGAAAA